MGKRKLRRRVKALEALWTQHRDDHAAFIQGRGPAWETLTIGWEDRSWRWKGSKTILGPDSAPTVTIPIRLVGND